MKGGAYLPAAQKLFCRLKQAGVRNVNLAIKAVTDAFGVKVKRFMSRCTGGQCIKEGGIYGLIQLGCKITHAPAFSEGTDGTTMCGITQESRHITLSMPSYEPGVDDDDHSTWSRVTCFAKALPALNHTAQCQFQVLWNLELKL
ncbi:hypothetical protein BT96DRAFT_834959 [Gymnopus androsaceus JB14]|uniref:Uncharacterized protein n=1 Tax=Gymnopus androsaceus JB14 TaxID=1447944 RepID=A0A6A4GWC1_9AGAR|nr:hypothetical protein BT96DRAFT_834959 [Gymnopus androsaceus JB14]